MERIPSARPEGSQNPASPRFPHRRSFLHATSKFAAAAAFLPALLDQNATGQQSAHFYDVTTNENLMRDHGILRRVLLMYAEVARRIDAKEDFPPQTAIDSVNIVRNFIEDYHQKLEDEHIFPLFRHYYRRNDVLRLYAQKLLDVVEILSDQHQVGRRLTDRILSALHSLNTPGNRQKLAQDLRAYVRMYTPHTAREDSVVFPALHIIIRPQEYEALGETFDEIGRKTFGNDGFDTYLDRVTAYEKYLGIYDLAQFTAKL